MPDGRKSGATRIGLLVWWSRASTGGKPNRGRCLQPNRIPILAAMNSFSRLTATSLLLAIGLTLPLRADDPPPGQVDFGTFTPSASRGQFVEVNVKNSLLTLAARLAEKQEPEVADLLRHLQSVRVNVVGVDDANRAELTARLKKVRTELESKGWDRVVTVQEKDQDVGVYLKQRNAEVIEGVVVTVIDGDKEAVFVNVVGDIRPEKLALIGDRLNIDPLKKAGAKISKHKEPADEKQN